jgi:hypothetical protein
MKELITVEKSYISGLLHKEFRLEQEEAKNRVLKQQYRDLEKRLYTMLMSEQHAEAVMQLGNYDESVNPIE